MMEKKKNQQFAKFFLKDLKIKTRNYHSEKNLNNELDSVSAS